MQTMTSREMIGRLVGFDTVSERSNLALIDFVEAYLSDHGVSARRTYDPTRNKANLFATLGPDIEGGVVLSGHTDVVPVTGQAWDSDPFEVTEKGGRLYGRGTADMKSFLAIALALVPEARNADLKIPIHLALSYDEEIGCFGAEGLIDDVRSNLPAPRMVVVGEPTSMKLVDAHKGCAAFVTTVTGKEAHSSQPHMAANAVFAAAELIAFLSQVADEKQAGPLDTRFDPPHTTVHVGTVNGGTALNIIPKHAQFDWEYRVLPGDDGNEILARFNDYAERTVLPRLRRWTAEAAIETRSVCDVPALKPESESPAETLVRRLTGLNHCEAVSYCAEAGMFQEAGFSTVICGPGSIDQAHRPNEFIEIDQVAACEDFIRKLIAWSAAA